MHDSSGKYMGRSAYKQPLSAGTTLSVAGKDVEIDDQIDRLAYLRVVKSSGKDTGSSTAAKSVTPKPMEDVLLPKPKLSLQAQMKVQMKKEKLEPKNKTTTPMNLHQGPRTSFKQPLKENSIMKQGPSETPIPRHDPAATGALVFKRPKKAPPGEQLVDVVLDPILGRQLRDHQKEGVKFLYECVMGLRDGNEGCILADDMGLGKTLQTIALLWTLIKQNPVYKKAPVVKKALVVCPAGLIDNWKQEFRKWLGRDKLGVYVFDDKRSQLRNFDGKSFNVMIIGYERLRQVADELTDRGIDIVICDEGHRLKSIQNKSAKAITSLNTAKRVILSGTPIQNDLNEFFAMVNFVNDGCLGSQKAFLKDFETPIMRSRQPNASQKDIDRGEEASAELARTTSPFILRRTADILAHYLPPKTEYVLFCNPTPEQASIYRQVLKSPMFVNALGSSETALQLITILKKLCNSPSLMRPKPDVEDATKDSLSVLNSMLPSNLSRYYTNIASTKIRLLDDLLQQIRTHTNDKVVLVSNYTSTLNLMENLLTNSGLPYLRLDGSIPASKRQDLVNQFNRTPATTHFAFLLSAKAGGVGINLIGANRLVLFDVDWNPAIDDQAMARIHRQGQKKPCKIYRFLVKGGLEEKIWQRQVVKRGLADSIMDGGGTGVDKTSNKGKKGTAAFSREELRDLFRLDESEGLRTHDLIDCDCQGKGISSASSTTVSSDTEPAIYDDTPAQSDSEGLEDLPDVTTLIKASKLTNEKLQTEEKRIASGTHPKQPGAKLRQDKELQELMQYLHLDTSGVSELDGDSADLERVDGIVDDLCLMEVLRKDEEELAGGVGYLFKKTSGSKLDAAAVEEGLPVVKKEDMVSSFFKQATA